MKKFVVVISLFTSLAALPAFGQGYGFFGSFPHSVWDGFTTPGLSVASTHVNLAFLWGPNGDVPMVESILNGVPTNSTILNSTWSVAAAWTDILNDPNFTFGVDNNTSAMAVAHSAPTGGFSYDGSAAFPITGTTIGNAYTLFVIGWDASYSTPQSAAANGAAVGWSQPFNYTVVSQITPPNTLSVVPFGVAGVPEPGVWVLMGFGGLPFLFFRQRK